MLLCASRQNDWTESLSTDDRNVQGSFALHFVLCQVERSNNGDAHTGDRREVEKSCACTSRLHVLYCCDENTHESLPRPYADGLPHPEWENSAELVTFCPNSCGHSIPWRILLCKVLQITQRNEELLSLVISTPSHLTLVLVTIESSAPKIASISRVNVLR